MEAKTFNYLKQNLNTSGSTESALKETRSTNLQRQTHRGDKQVL